MSSSIPIPSILDRSAGYMTLQWKNDPDILGYRVRVSNSLVNAYGPFNGVGGAATAAEAIFDIQRGQNRLSKAIRLKGLGVSGDTTRGQTRMTYDPNEFFDPPTTTTVPPDSQLTFMRIQVRTTASPTFPGGVFPGTFTAANQSNILVVQNPGFYSVPSPALSLYGVAPTVATALPGLPAPPEAMVFHVPGSGEGVVISNHGVVDLLVAFGNNQPLMIVAAGDSIYPSGGMGDQLIVCAAAGNPPFSMVIATVNG
jgi:hypothetical protein